MKKPVLFYLAAIILSFSATLNAGAQEKTFTFSGTVSVEGAGNPVEMATVVITETNQWAVADNKGHFSIKNVRKGSYNIVVSYLGYVPLERAIDIDGDTDIVFYMKEDNLTIQDVVITARENTASMNTSRKIEKTALDHLQMVNMSDISALLPGGKTVNPNLMNDNAFTIRGGNAPADIAAFGTAVEVDGVRLSTNSAFGDMGGASTRNIASSNIESIEVITGIPSAEYGDLTGGMIKVNTRKGKTPYNVTLMTNPNTKQVSVGKGFGLGDKGGVLNANLEHTKAISNPVSPYTSYQRNVLNLSYSNTFNQNSTPVSFSAGITGNLGGMNSENDPDAVTGTFTKVNDNALRFHTSADWLLNKPWITNMELKAAVNYADKATEAREYFSNASQAPAVNTTNEGYFIANQLPLTYYNTKFIDSKQLDYTASFKMTQAGMYGKVNNKVKLGLDYTANGNIGKGEYYKRRSLQPNGYRPRPYSEIPYMHNFAAYLEDNVSIPVGNTTLAVMAGVRAEKTYIAGSKYKNTLRVAPRFNAKWTLIDGAKTDKVSYLSIRGGFGITEKLPSFNILYPVQQYRDIQVFGASYGDNRSVYVYHTTPYKIEHNENLRWMRNRNIDAAVDIEFYGMRFTLVGFYNKTINPYRLMTQYSPFSYKVLTTPLGYSMPSNPEIVVDNNTGNIYVGDRNNVAAGVTQMNTKVTNRTFVKNIYQDNGSPVNVKGLEFVADFGQIKSIRTSFIFDARYTVTEYLNDGLMWHYQDNLSHTELPDRSYEYAGIYVDTGGTSTTYNGRKTKVVDANLTIKTHIPSIRMVISLRLESSLLYRHQNISEYNGKRLAFTVGEDSNTPTGGNIMDGDSYTAIYPLMYMDLDGNIHDFTETQANDPAFSNLIIRSGNAYQYKKDGYDPYFFANLSVTKEIGNLASISFYANNFTNSRKYLTSHATGMKVIRTPEYYYGMTLRLKF